MANAYDNQMTYDQQQQQPMYYPNDHQYYSQQNFGNMQHQPNTYNNAGYMEPTSYNQPQYPNYEYDYSAETAQMQAHHQQQQ